MSDLCEFAREELQFYADSRLLNRIARRAGTDRKTLVRIREGREPQTATLEKILDAMGYDIIVRKRKETI